MPLERIRDAASIVLLGSFNPAIFHPAWFSKHKLIQKKEEEGATTQVVAREVSSFRAGWLNLQVVPERFSATVENADDFPLLRDLVIGTFTLLEHSPISALGMNRDIQFQMPDDGTWHHVGHVLLPKALWRKHLKEPGLMQAATKARRDDDEKGHIFVQVRPVLAKTNVVEVAFNSQIDFPKNSTAAQVAPVITKYWDATLEFGQSVAVDLVTDAIKAATANE